MFGLSFAELIIVILVALIFIKPQDLPEIAHFLGKIFYRAKYLLHEIKKSLKEAQTELGLDELKHEVNRGIVEEKVRLQEEMTVIVDIYGNEHKVPNLNNLRPDLTAKEMNEEIKNLNEKNLKLKTSNVAGKK
jgi:sec-independent protein translocase protein TatB